MKKIDIEQKLREHTAQSLNEAGYPYTVDNFLLDVDEPYRAGILDYQTVYKKIGAVGISQFCAKASYMISFEIPLTAIGADAARDEANRIELRVFLGVMKLEKCAGVMQITEVSFMKSATQDPYRSMETDNALMLELVCTLSLEYKEDFNS